MTIFKLEILSYSKNFFKDTDCHQRPTCLTQKTYQIYIDESLQKCAIIPSAGLLNPLEIAT